MHHEKHDPGRDLPKGDPALLFIVNLVTLRQRPGILKHQRSPFEVDPMLDQIAPALVLIELKSHGTKPLSR